MTTVSALVVSYRTGPSLFGCLGALIDDAQVDEIVLVDNGNPPETLLELQKLAAPKLRITGEGVNRGFGAGVNLAAREARGSRFLIINPDALIGPGSIPALEAARVGQSEPVIVGGLIHDAQGVEQRGCRRRTLTLASAAATFLGLKLGGAFRSINRHDEPAPVGPVPMEAVSGALMYVSREGFETLGGFDEGYFLHVEDLDLCRRAHQLSGAVIYTPLAAAMHVGGTSDAPSLTVERHKAAGLRRYFAKFAKGPVEAGLAFVVGWLASAALEVRARVRG